MVGLYLLNKLSVITNKEYIGLYRDDGLAVFINANESKMDRLRKEIITTFKNEELTITVDTNLVETDILDVSFNIVNKMYKP